MNYIGADYDTFKIVICHLAFGVWHFPFVICHLSYKAKAFDKSFKGVKCVLITIVSSNISEVTRAILNFFIQKLYNQK